MTSDFGKVYTKGTSFRARAEARQREYRATVLEADAGAYGHFLDPKSTDSGMNFLVPDAFQAAKQRQASGKGVAQRTFENMLSSQAMCFNIFQPLSGNLDLATAVLSHFFPFLAAVTSITIEHTPDNDIFGDQSAMGGVDCDVLIEGNDAGGSGIVIVVETKFVEEEFSICGFRKAGRAAKGMAVCPEQVAIGSDKSHCLYTSRRNYHYWSRTSEYGVLKDGALAESGCPFSGPLWQLWVNHVLAHAEADRRGAGKAYYAVCASAANQKLLQHESGILDQFRSLLTAPESLVFMDLDALIEAIDEISKYEFPDYAQWASQLAARYGLI